MVAMKSSLITLAYATSLVAAQSPTPTKACNRDNCFRQLIQSPAVVSPFCATYTQPPAALPTFVSACQGLASRVSSACSCLHPAATATGTAATCNRDNCFRQLIQSPDAVGPFCASYTKPPAPLPTFVSACQGLSSRVSSACSCLYPSTTSASSTATATPSSGVTVRVSASGGNATNGHQYGFLHEDINNSGDGGIYAELLRNRAFQYSEKYPASLDAWYPFGGAALSLQNLSQPLSKALKTNVRVTPAKASGVAGLFNDGYWGMDVRKQKYSGSFWVKGTYEGKFTAWLLSNLTGESFGSVNITSKATAAQWTQHNYTLIPERNAPNSNNTFALTFDAAGTKGEALDFGLISLFPPTFKDRPNGMRPDLVETLQGLYPTLFRLPGGNMLEGNTLTSWWDWKDSLGPLHERPGFAGVWGYQQTHGLGLLEYLQFAEDMNMEIIVGVFAGLALNGQFLTAEQLPPIIADALDQIEFIRGPVTSKWGAVRASLGHPAPFKLDYIEVGNEDWLAGGDPGWESYKAYRFPMFLKAINAAYPDIEVIASGSTRANNYTIPPPGAGDYHTYATPDSLVDEFDYFDNEPVKHLVGEMAAVHPNGGLGWSGPGLMPLPWWGGAVGEAVSLLGYERNADRIIGACYAPIFANRNRWAWSITMVQFQADPAKTVRATSWFVWSLMAKYVFTETLPSTSNFDPLYYVAGKNSKTGAHTFKAAVYNATATVPVSLTFDGVAAGTSAELTVLTGPANVYESNDPADPSKNVVVSTVSTVKSDAAGVFKFTLPDMSVAVLTTKPEKKKRHWERAIGGGQ